MKSKSFNLCGGMLLIGSLSVSCMPDSFTDWGGKKTKDEAKAEVFAYDMQLSAVFKNYRSFHMHKEGAGNGNLGCVINTIDDNYLLRRGVEDVLCFLEVEENDLQYNEEFSLNLKVSGGKCDYISYAPYWYWGAKGGYTRGIYANNTANVNYPDTKTYPAPFDSSNTFYYSSAECKFRSNFRINVTDATPTDLSFIGIEAPTPDMICQYDYSQNDHSPNCDEGGYYVVPVEFDTDLVDATKCADGSAKLGNPTFVKCNGKPYNCVDGEGTLYEKNKAGRPVGEIYSNFNDLQAFDKSWEMSKLAGKKPNIFLANYTRVCGGERGTLTDTTLYDAEGLLLRNNYVLLNGPDDLVSFYGDKYTIEARAYSTDPLVNANPFYDFTCLDGAHEVKARIRLIIRDWNVTFSTITDLAEIESPSPISKINFTGREPLVNNYYNDFRSWDDFNMSNGVPTGSYNDYANIDPDERYFYSINTTPARCEEDYSTQHFLFPGLSSDY